MLWLRSLAGLLPGGWRCSWRKTFRLFQISTEGNPQWTSKARLMHLSPLPSYGLTSVFSDLPPTFWATTTLKFKYSMSTTTAIQDQLGQPIFPPHLPSPLPFPATMKLPPANTHPPSIPNSITLPLLSLLAFLPCCHSTFTCQVSVQPNAFLTCCLLFQAVSIEICAL